MKKSLSILLLALCSWYVISCGSSTKNDNTTLTISCTDCAGFELSLTKSNMLPSAANEVYKSIFDSLGQAKIEFPLRDTTALVLLVGKQEDREPKFYQLYFEPGVHVDLTIKNGVPEFEGDLKRVNTYYTQAANIHKEMNQYSNDNIDKVLKGSASEKQVFWDSLMKFGSELKSQISNDNSISAYDRQMLHDYISLSGIVQHMNFDTRVAFHEINDKGISVFLDSTLSNAFNDLTLDIRYRNNSLYTWFLSRRLVPIFYDIIEYREENKVQVGEYEYVKEAVMQDVKLTDFKELLLALFVEYRTRLLYNYDDGLKLVNLFQKDFPQSQYLDGLNGILAEYYDLKSGMPMKDFVMQDIAGKPFNLSDLKGKLLYVDIWATWCGPCIEELDYSVELSKKYSHKTDLQFVYVSIDQNTEAWKKYVNKNPQIQGIHGVHNLDFIPDSNHVSNLYKIQGIPRYLLIDKEGKIVSYKAKSPSQLLKDNYLDSLLAR